MPFVLKKVESIKGKKLNIFLMNNLEYSLKDTQRLVSKGRIFDLNMNSYKITDIIKEDYILMALFEGHSKGLKPLIEFDDFAVFDKPTNLMIHPISKKTPYSLLDEIRFHFGESANSCHRIDAETSGLVIVSKKKEAEIALKDMFLQKKYHKSYLTIVRGKIENSLKIDSKLDKENGNIGVRMAVSESGKESLTTVNPIKYNTEKDLTLVEAIPLTGRQHQIRIHLHSIGHTILGDPVYGIEDEITDSYLNKTLSKEDRIKYTKSHRLWLHANYLEFNYKNKKYKIFSKNNDIIKEFYSKP